MKARMYWAYATRSLVRGGQRTLLAIFCVAIGVLAIVALQLVGNAVEAGLTGNIQATNGGDISLTTSGASPLTAADVAYINTLEAQGQITTFTVVDQQGAQLRLGTAALRSQVAAVDPAQFPLAGAPIFTSPANATLASVLQGDNIVVTTPIAQALNLHVGETAALSAVDGRATTVTIAGIVQSTGYFQGRHTLMSLAAYAALPSISKTPITYNSVYINVPGHTDANATSIAALLQAHFPLAQI